MTDKFNPAKVVKTFNPYKLDVTRESEYIAYRAQICFIFLFNLYSSLPFYVSPALQYFTASVHFTNKPADPFPSFPINRMLNSHVTSVEKHV